LGEYILPIASSCILPCFAVAAWLQQRQLNLILLHLWRRTILWASSLELLIYARKKNKQASRGVAMRMQFMLHGGSLQAVCDGTRKLKN
jgi:hypothetical protein